MMKTLESIGEVMRVEYKAYESSLLNDAYGYVKPENLIQWEKAEEGKHYFYEGEDADESEEPQICEGYRFVEVQGEWYVVKESDMYTEVWEEKGLYSGWGCNCPTGGISDACEPDYIGTTMGEEGEEAEVYLIIGI